MPRQMIRPNGPLLPSSRVSSHVWHLASNTDVVRFDAPETVNEPITS